MRNKEQLSPDQGYVHSVVTGGSVDGPGVRFVIFTTGCPLRCLYCHNPDTRNMTDGKLVKASDLVEEASSYADFMKRTGGGVTVSGGEPLFQQAFVTEIFKGCKARGIHTALDTSGYLGEMVKDDLLSVTDLVLLDIKSFDHDTYRKLTGMNVAPTLAFAQKLARKGVKMWVRCVIVPDLTDDLDALRALADFLAPLGCVERVEILPFHKMGEEKWKKMGLEYKLAHTQPPSPELMEQIHAIFQARGFETH